ncbi:hypothetical protein E2I00_014844, partial [Balaenoptera physalus]
VLASARTMPVTFALLLLLSQASADPCYHPGGRPRFCLPPVTQLAAMAASCPQACIPSPGADLGPRATCNGSLTLALGGPFLLTSVSLRFCTPGPPALTVTFRAPLGPKARVVASHLRVELGGQAGLAAAGGVRAAAHPTATGPGGLPRPGTLTLACPVPATSTRDAVGSTLSCSGCRAAGVGVFVSGAATTQPGGTATTASRDPQCQNYCNISDTRVHMSLRRYCQQDYEFHDLLQPDISEGGRWPPEDGRRTGNWLNGRDPCTVLSVSDPLPPIRV